MTQTARSAHQMTVFFDDAYVAAAHSSDTTRKAGRIAASLRRRPIDGVRIAAPAPATCPDLERVHDVEYVDALVSGDPPELAESAGLGWDPGYAESLFASTGGCIAAAEAAWTDGVAGSLSSGLHHARRHGGAGFCSVNGLALAARALLDIGADRVLIVDLDAHCGGGTWDILGDDERFSAIDVSTSSFDAYEPDGDWTLDIAPDADAYLEIVAERLDTIDPGRVSAVVYNAGMDPHEDCGTGGMRGITDDVLAEREHLVFARARQAGLPIAWVLAGGYSGGAMATAHLTDLHRLTIEASAPLASAA